MNDRLKICIVCEHYDESKQKCKKCGCNMKIKTAIPLTKCPIGKW